MYIYKEYNNLIVLLTNIINRFFKKKIIESYQLKYF